MGWPSFPKARDDRSVWMPPNVSGQDVQFDADEWARGRIEDAMWCRDSPDPVAEIASGIADALDLGVFGEWVGHLQVPSLDLTPDGEGIQQRPIDQCIHLRHQRFQVVCDDEVGAVAFEGLDRAGGRAALVDNRGRPGSTCVVDDPRARVILTTQTETAERGAP
jgi:hypothetical protein